MGENSTLSFINISDDQWKIHKLEDEENYLRTAKGVLFVMCSIFAGIAIHFGSKKYDYPYTVGCFVFGVLVGLMDIHSSFVREYTLLTRMDPSDMLLIFLPILIFESSFGMDAHMFYRALPQCITLAVFGFVLCTALTAVFAKFVLKSYDWSWLTAVVFGSIVSATDPVAVVALLKEMRMPHSFTILIEGESLLNDGVAIVLYEILSHHIATGKSLHADDTFIELLKTGFGAPAFGYVMGKITEWIMIRIYISPVSEMTITFVLAYISYFVAERFLGISAVLAVVLYGVTLSANKMCISPESEHLIHTDWRLLSVFANTLIFIIVGILVSVSLKDYYDYLDSWLILATYSALTVFRALMILIFYPILLKTGYGLTWKEAIVLSWGGLRGAIGLALSLMLVSNPEIDPSENTNKVLVQVSGIIVLTLIVNANTIKYVMKLIKFKQITLVNRLSMGNAIACITEVKEKSLRICRQEWKFKRADWVWVSRKISIRDPYKGGLYGDDPSMGSLFIPYGTCDECMSSIMPYKPSDHEMKDLNEAARKRVLRAMKGSVWKQFRGGLIQRRTLKFLCIAADNASDNPEAYLKTEEVRKNFMEIKKHVRWMGSKVPSVIKRFETITGNKFDLEMHLLKKTRTKGLRTWLSWFYFRWWFEPFICFVIILNIIHIAVDVDLIVIHKEQKYGIAMSILGGFFSLFYVWEATVKIAALKWKHYIKSSWNKFDFSLTVMAVLEGILDYFAKSLMESHKLSVVLRIFVALRILRVIRALREIFLLILKAFQSHFTSELYYAYDIGRGFLFANEAVLKNIDMIVDFGPCAKLPIYVCESNIKKMLDALDEFEKEYPSVALALQSNRAARRILNRVKSLLERFKERSLILREDVKEINSIIFKMIKKVVYAPKVRPYIQDIPKVLGGVDWITHPELIKEVNDNHLVCTFSSGKIVQEEGLRHKSLFIIAKGIVKVVGRIEESKSSQIHMYNKLPNSDSLLLFQRTESGDFHEYLTTSQTIGLLGFLQKTYSVTTVICEKNCELLQIDYSLLNSHEKKYGDLIFSMWRSIGIKISAPLLKQQPRYKNCSAEDINLRLQKGILPDTSTCTYWDVPSIIDDMVIVQGRVKDSTSHTTFNGPAYIPSSFRSLHMFDEISKRPRIIIILLLNKKYDLHTCQHWVKFDDINDSSICSIHKIRRSSII